MDRMASAEEARGAWGRKEEAIMRRRCALKGHLEWGKGGKRAGRRRSLGGKAGKKLQRNGRGRERERRRGANGAGDHFLRPIGYSINRGRRIDASAASRNCGS